ncbi:uncharacterized protein [Typha angustifolia]|uniref:uncharacterized protein n=1 Tax=Typha angustifolia TaxID=59011 RepID=UPI003C2FA968
MATRHGLIVSCSPSWHLSCHSPNISNRGLLTLEAYFHRPLLYSVGVSTHGSRYLVCFFFLSSSLPLFLSKPFGELFGRLKIFFQGPLFSSGTVSPKRYQPRKLFMLAEAVWFGMGFRWPHISSLSDWLIDLHTKQGNSQRGG